MTHLWGIGAAALLGLALIAPPAQAQQKAPEQKPATTAPAPATTPDAKAAKKAPKKAEKKAEPSPCKGLDEKACPTTAGCIWRPEAEIKKGDRKGQKIKAHCRKDTPPPAKKKDASVPPGTMKAPAATPPPSSAGEKKK